MKIELLGGRDVHKLNLSEKGTMSPRQVNDSGVNGKVIRTKISRRTVVVD